MDLEDKEEIRDLLCEFCLRADAADADGWAGLFCDDGTFTSDPGPTLAQVEPLIGREALHGYALAKFPAINGVHLSTNAVIRVSGDQATASSYVVFILDRPQPRVATAGRFEDRLVKVNGQWRFASRHVTFKMMAG